MGSDFQCFCQGSKKILVGVIDGYQALEKKPKQTEYEIKNDVSIGKVRALDLPSLS